DLLAARGQQLKERGIVVVSESGFYTPDDLHLVAKAGATGVLIGESLVKQPDPELAIKSLVSDINSD
ncbi:MAG TPA: indole-3-glycerol-phosphate synthase TrpC, partial [Phormidium sp.]